MPVDAHKYKMRFPVSHGAPKMRASHGLILASAVLLASACGGKQESQDTSPERPEAAAGPTGLWFEPKALSSCETKTLVKVHWNVAAMEGVKAVNVFTVRPGGEEAMFARRARPAGMKRTGHWIRAGREFVVRDPARGTSLARAAVGTLPCATGPESSAP
ncbi:MAG TPA: hypothetical protein VM619_00445 [Luteimonas sp.]|nr:hypothetical protein [Luteimonas sp.]